MSRISPADLVPQLRPRTAALGGAAAGVVAGLGETLGKALGDAMKSRRPVASSASTGGRVAEATGTALQAAAGQLKYVAGETVMVGAWAGALGGVIYYGLLRPAQRERVRSTLQSVVEQVRALRVQLRAGTEDYASRPK
jgi:hypothetical protein